MLGTPIKDNKCTLNEFVKQSESCVKYIDFIESNYGDLAKYKMNITVGFGFVSHNNGLSIGLPIDIYTMLLTSEKARRQVLQAGAKVHIIIADHLAFACQHPSCRNLADVIKVRDKYIKKINHILTNLNIAQQYEIHLTSNIVKTKEYQTICKNLDAQAGKLVIFNQDEKNPKKMNSPEGDYHISTDTCNILNCAEYDQSNRAYFMDQTAVIQYMFEQLGCGIKVSWTKARQHHKILQSVSFDEPHFDRFYRDLYFDHTNRISFIYTKPGFAANRVDEYAKAIPYTAAPIEGTERVLFSSKQKSLITAKINPDLCASIEMNVKTLSEIQPEVDNYVLGRQTDIDAFYKNVSYLRSFSKAPSKHLSIQFVEKLKIASDEQHDKLGKVEKK